MRKPRILDIGIGSVAVVVYGNPSPQDVIKAIAPILPDPKRGTREDWASLFYNTGIQRGAGTIWNYSA